jgi:hypothetical protein
MTTNSTRVDFDALVREARMERSLAIGNAIAGVIGGLSNTISSAFATIARGPNHPKHVAHPPV